MKGLFFRNGGRVYEVISEVLVKGDILVVVIKSDTPLPDGSHGVGQVEVVNILCVFSDVKDAREARP